MIFSHHEYKKTVKFLPLDEIRSLNNEHEIKQEFLYIVLSVTELTLRMHICHIREDNKMLYW